MISKSSRHSTFRSKPLMLLQSKKWFDILLWLDKMQLWWCLSSWFSPCWLVVVLETIKIIFCSPFLIKLIGILPTLLNLFLPSCYDYSHWERLTQNIDWNKFFKCGTCFPQAFSFVVANKKSMVWLFDSLCS